MKKAVITAFDVNTARKAGQTSIAVPDNALITPQAADDARAYGITLARAAKAPHQDSQQALQQIPAQVSRQIPSQVPHLVPHQARPAITPPANPPANPMANPVANPVASPAANPANAGRSSGVPHPQTHQGAEMAAEVRRQVLARLGNAAPASLDFVISSVMAERPFIRKAGAVSLVSSAALPRENSGTSPAAVSMVEAVPPGAAHPGVSYMCWENSSFAWTFRHDEVLVVLEGDVTLAVDGTALAGKPGDAFLIPAGSAVTISAKGKARCVYSSWFNPATPKG